MTEQSNNSQTLEEQLKNVAENQTVDVLVHCIKPKSDTSDMSRAEKHQHVLQAYQKATQPIIDYLHQENAPIIQASPNLGFVYTSLTKKQVKELSKKEYVKDIYLNAHLEVEF